jgi:hypothetical protein
MTAGLAMCPGCGSVIRDFDFREAPELMVPSAAVQFAMTMSNAAGGLLEAT